MADIDWNALISDDDDNGDLDDATNYSGGSKATASDNLRFTPEGNRPVTAGLDAYAAVALGKIINNQFPAKIGASDEFMEFLSATKLKHDGLADCYYQGDCPLVIIYDTGAGAVHLRNDNGAGSPQDFDLVYALGGVVFIDDHPTNNTDLDTLHVFPGAEVTIAEGVVRAGTKKIVFHGGGIVHDKTGGDILIEGDGGVYYLEDDAALTHSGALDIGVKFVHLSSGDCGDLNLINKGELETKNNTRGGTAGDITRFPSAKHDLDSPESGVTADSVAEAVEGIAA
tara:strand:+ start:235 stop:1086 length:852 start_codon:yes stop_codon:yes gene_type:complete